MSRKLRHLTAQRRRRAHSPLRVDRHVTALPRNSLGCLPRPSPKPPAPRKLERSCSSSPSTPSRFTHKRQVGGVSSRQTRAHPALLVARSSPITSRAGEMRAALETSSSLWRRARRRRQGARAAPEAAIAESRLARRQCPEDARREEHQRSESLLENDTAPQHDRGGMRGQSAAAHRRRADHAQHKR